MPNHHELLNEIKRLKAIADTGLLYSNTDFDKERYTELQEMSFRLLSKITGDDIETIKNFYLEVKDYPTVKVDLRGIVLNDEKKILMVQESTDRKWSLPGGWADIGYSPSEAIVK